MCPSRRELEELGLVLCIRSSAPVSTCWKVGHPGRRGRALRTTRASFLSLTNITTHSTNSMEYYIEEDRRGSEREEPAPSLGTFIIAGHPIAVHRQDARSHAFNLGPLARCPLRIEAAKSACLSVAGMSRRVSTRSQDRRNVSKPVVKTSAAACSSSFTR